MDHGMKFIQINAQTNYPIVSAYEFESLKSEDEVLALMKPCTIYFILQRPVIYINEFRATEKVVEFHITDDRNTNPLICRMNLVENKLCNESETHYVQAQFYKKEPDTIQPLNDMAAFKVLNHKEEFIAWYSPQKFIYEYFSGSIKATIEGNIEDYLDYHIHYIGQAFSQDIWDRLTGHEKFQSILIKEDSLNEKNLKPSFEISLLMLDINGFDEAIVFPACEDLTEDGSKSIMHEINDLEAFEDYNKPFLGLRDLRLTNEVEAMLVNKFKPEYNSVLFNNYPEIKSGTRNAGYTQSTLQIEKMPAILRTANHAQHVVFPNI